MYLSKMSALNAITKITIFLAITTLLQLSSNPNKLTLADERSINLFSKQSTAEIEQQKTIAELTTYLAVSLLHHFILGKNAFIERWKSAILSKMCDAIETQKTLRPRADINYHQRLALNILKEHLNEWNLRKSKLKEKARRLSAQSRRSKSE